MKITPLMTNENREIFACILLIAKYSNTQKGREETTLVLPFVSVSLSTVSEAGILSHIQSFRINNHKKNAHSLCFFYRRFLPVNLRNSSK